MKDLEVKCPHCSHILVIDRLSGKIIEHRKPILEEGESTGDRFQDAKKKVEQSADRIEAKVAEAKKQQSEKLSKLDALFKERQKEIVESGEPIERPDSPFKD